MNRTFFLGQLVESFYFQYGWLFKSDAVSLFMTILYRGHELNFPVEIKTSKDRARGISGITKANYPKAINALCFEDSPNDKGEWLLKHRHGTSTNEIWTINYDNLMEIWDIRLEAAKEAREKENSEVLEVTYQSYLESAHWKQTRTDALKRAWYKCQICSSKDKLQVHHNNYNCLGNESPSDLIVVCDRCHDLIYQNVQEFIK